MNTMLSCVPTRDEVQPAAQQVLDNLQGQLGMIPNLYAYLGHSANALTSYVAFQQAQAKGSFKAREREAVFLAVSEVNGCEYCQAAHTALGKLNGFTEEETRQLRAGHHPDRKLGVLARLASAITAHRGRVDSELVEDFFAAGYDEAALVDLVALVADKTLSNYLHNLVGFDVDFPAAEPLEDAVAC